MDIEQIAQAMLQDQDAALAPWLVQPVQVQVFHRCDEAGGRLVCVCEWSVE